MQINEHKFFANYFAIMIFTFSAFTAHGTNIDPEFEKISRLFQTNFTINNLGSVLLYCEERDKREIQISATETENIHVLNYLGRFASRDMLKVVVNQFEERIIGFVEPGERRIHRLYFFN